MSFLQKLFGEKPPQWAQPISPQLFKEFKDQVTSAILSHDASANFDWENGTANLPQGQQTMAFGNLIKIWIGSDPGERSTIPAKFVNSLYQQQSAEPTKLADRLDDLLIRVYDLEVPGIEVMTNQPIGNFLLPTLVIDTEHATITVNKDQVAESGYSVEELFNIAKKNLWAKITPDIQRYETPAGPITIVHAPYVGAGFVATLDRLTEAGELYWVATPSRELVVLMKPSDTGRETLLHFLSKVAEMSAASEAYYILPFVLEYKDGVYRDLCKRGDGTIEII